VQKFVCDRCGGECTYYRMLLSGTVFHTTAKSEQVGCDDIKPRELCKTCADTLVEEFGLEIRPDSYGPDESARVEGRPILRDIPG
jgi:hypothetical protein